MSLILVLACVCPSSDDTNTAGESEASPWMRGIPTSEVDQLFYFNTEDVFLRSSVDGITEVSARATNAAFWMTSRPTTLADYSQGATDDRCGTYPMDTINYTSDTSSKVLDVGSDQVTLTLEVDGAEALYWWSPGVAPDWAFVSGAEMALDDADLGVQTPEQVDLEMDADTWETYLQTGTLSLRWAPGDHTLVEVDRPEADFRVSSCLLVDDGEATIQFPTPPDPQGGSPQVYVEGVNAAVTASPLGGVRLALAESYTSVVTAAD